MTPIILERPEMVRRDIPFRGSAKQHRKRIRDILHGKDERLLVIAGPCSIFNTQGALEFAERFARLRAETADKLELVLRVPPAKPRTVSKAGQWEGLIHEPHAVAQYEPTEGIRLSRTILRDIAQMDIPLAIELLDTKRTRYFDDVLSLTWTGARTVENSELRRQASGMPWPVGFKNRTDGAIKPALDAIESASGANFYDATDSESGATAVLMSAGNKDAFLILRGGEKALNYAPEDVAAAQAALKARNLLEFVVVDSAHGNSVDENGVRTHKRQIPVFESTVGEWLGGNKKLGAMMEVYLKEGKQEVTSGTSLDSLDYALSPTDSCVGWDDFESAIRQSASRM